MKTTASLDTLFEQASSTAATYLANAQHSINRRFGDGYAEEHPELVAKFIEVAGRDFNESVRLKILEEEFAAFRELLSDSVDQIVEALKNK
jgi:hypothetical protein